VTFCLHLDEVNILWEWTNRTDFVAESFIGFMAIIRVLEGLIDFVAFLVQKLWHGKTF